MDSKITSFNRAKQASGFGLSEFLVVMGLSSLLSVALMCLLMLSGRSFAAIYNYVDLDDANRVCMDQMSRDIRQANRVKSYTTNGPVVTLTLEDSDLSDISYVFNVGQRTLYRTKNGYEKAVLQECDSLRFDLSQRTPKDGSLEVYEAATVDLAKVIDVSWVCSRKIMGRKENTESVQTARIVIRKQGT